MGAEAVGSQGVDADQQQQIGRVAPTGAEREREQSQSRRSARRDRGIALLQDAAPP